MTDKEMKLERFKEENKNAVKGQIVLTGSSLMEMFPVNKFLAERGSDIIVYKYRHKRSQRFKNTYGSYNGAL